MSTTADGERRSFLILLAGEVAGERFATFRILEARDHADAKELALTSLRSAPALTALLAEHRLDDAALEVVQIVELVALPSYWRDPSERGERSARRRAWWQWWKRKP